MEWDGALYFGVMLCISFGRLFLVEQLMFAFGMINKIFNFLSILLRFIYQIHCLSYHSITQTKIFCLFQGNCQALSLFNQRWGLSWLVTHLFSQLEVSCMDFPFSQCDEKVSCLTVHLIIRPSIFLSLYCPSLFVTLDLQKFSVPQRFFSHFYIVGALWTIRWQPWLQSHLYNPILIAIWLEVQFHCIGLVQPH